MNYTSRLKLGLMASSCLSLSPLFLTPQAYGEEAAMPEIVVSATRYEQPLSEIGSSVSVITSDDLEKSQTTFVQDALQRVPGLSLNQNGAFGGVSSVRIRGAASAQTVIMIDGIKLNDVSSPSGGFNFANLDATGIERIEVLRGPQSILYGSDAMGGVINIITPSGKEGLGGSAFAEGGSFGTFRTGGNIAGGTDKLTFNLSSGFITTDGISKADKRDGNTEKDGYQNISVNGKITAKLTEDHSLQLISRYVDNRNDYDGFPAPFYSLSDTGDVSFSEEFLVAGRGFFNFLDGAFNNTLSVEYSTIDRRGELDGVPVSYLTYEGERLNLDYFGHYKINHDFGISVGLQHEETKADTLSPMKFNIDSSFTELSFQGIEGLILTAGLRYDDHNQYGGTTTPRFTGSYYIAQTQTKVFANWGEGFKAPTIYQLTDGYSGNPALKPEESNGWEIGFEQDLLENRLQIGATYFDQKFKNMIAWNSAYYNIDNVRTKGVEVFGDLQVTNSVSVDGNYTYTDAKNTNSDTALIRVPKHAAYGEIQWRAIKDFNLPLSLSLSMTYNGKESETWVDGPKGWTRFDIHAAYQVNDIVELYGRVDNLFDKEYQQVNGYGTPGQSFFAGVRGKF